MIERENLAGTALYQLMFRLLKAYREANMSTRPDVVRYPGQLSMLLGQIDAAAEDCRELLRLKLEGGDDARSDLDGPGLAGGDAVGGGHGRVRASAR
jgi:hypothetical protein